MIPPSLLPLLVLTLLLAPLISGSDRVSCLETPELLLNRRKVEDDALICEVLDSCLASGRFFRDPRVEEWARIRNRHCNSDTALPYPARRHLPPEDYLGKTGRKLLLQLQEEASLTEHHPLDDKSIVMPGMFLMCCAVLCPCFRARRKKVTEHHPLSRELNSMDSISLEINSAPEKTPATPLRVPPSPSRLSLSPQLSRIGSIHLSISQIMKATQSFSPSLKVGEGGFGTVYRGVLPEGHVVAVKRAKRELIPDLRDEFSNEVELLSKIEHRNLVKLLGYNDKGNERIIISEFVPNGTLREHLDGQHGKILDFNQRLEIAIDVAHGLTYLHLYAEKPIIHRDVKSSNILLTESYRAKVSDFGFARVGATDEGQTHIMTKVKGTAGYLDPEYLQTYQLTPKSDVYSFGILLIEILSARRPVETRRAIDERITVRWAFNKYNEGNLIEMLDPLLEKTVDGEVLAKLFGLAFQCAAPTRADRPTMREVCEQLWEIRKDHGSSHRNN